MEAAFSLCSDMEEDIHTRKLNQHGNLRKHKESRRRQDGRMCSRAGEGKWRVVGGQGVGVGPGTRQICLVPSHSQSGMEQTLAACIYLVLHHLQK